jgi:tetratricopeptide (TPR) repeat protein
MSDERAKISDLDGWLRSGRGADVRRELSELDTKKISRGLLVDWATLARRAGMITLSLRLLRPVIRVKRGLGQNASAKERASYAASLGAIGALTEAYGVLKGLEKSEVPEVQLFYGFTHVYSWDYVAAAPFFETYVQLDTPSPFQKAVAAVNLAAAYCFLGRYEEVLALTEKLIAQSTKENWIVLNTEAHLLRAQAMLNLDDFKQSAFWIEKASALSTTSNVNSLHIEKWRSLLALKSQGATSDVTSRLLNLKLEASRSKLWEISRDCDYHLGLETKDRVTYERVFFGTPFRPYRERLLKAASWFKPRGSYLWTSNDDSEHGLDLAELPTERHDAPVYLRVLRAISTDFYRPLKIGCLFNEIYPGEYYDPDSSPIRVKTAISRTRSLLKETALPLEIRCIKQDYYLAMTGPCYIKVRLNYPEKEIGQVIPIDFLRKLKKNWPHRSFSSHQAAEVLSISQLKAQRLLKVAAAENKLYKSGLGRARLYRFKK